MSAVEVRPEYKLTEVGGIPEEWEVQPLGKQLQRPPQYGLNAAAIDHDEAFPTYLRITDISDDGRFVPAPRVSVKTSNKDAYLLGQGDLVIARTGASVGKSYLFSTSDGELVFAGYLIRFTPDPKKLDPHFLSLYTRSKPYWDWVSVMSARSGQPGINGREYADMPVPLPPLPEQRAIAAALGDVDALLAALERLIAKRRAVKQAAMDALLSGRVRLVESGEWTADSSAPSSARRPLSTVRYKLTEVGEIPEDWEVVAFGELASIRNQKITPDNVPPDTPCVDLEHIAQGRGTLLTYSLAYETTSTKYCFKKGDVLFGRLRAYLEKYWLATFDGICTTEIWPLTARENKSIGPYVFYLVQTPGFIEMASVSYGTHMPRTDWNVIKMYPVPLPPLPEQRAIAGVLSDMDAAIAALERQRAKVQAIKQGMMQELLTGRVRLV